MRPARGGWEALLEIPMIALVHAALRVRVGGGVLAEIMPLDRQVDRFCRSLLLGLERLPAECPHAKNTLLRLYMQIPWAEKHDQILRAREAIGRVFPVLTREDLRRFVPPAPQEKAVFSAWSTMVYGTDLAGPPEEEPLPVLEGPCSHNELLSRAHFAAVKTLLFYSAGYPYRGTSIRGDAVPEDREVCLQFDLPEETPASCAVLAANACGGLLASHVSPFPDYEGNRTAIEEIELAHWVRKLRPIGADSLTDDWEYDMHEEMAQSVLKSLSEPRFASSARLLGSVLLADYKATPGHLREILRKTGFPEG